MENICIIYDNDEVYAKRLMGMLSEDVRLQLAIWIFTDRERLIECIQVHADNVGLIIAGENIYNDIIRDYYGGKVILLLEEGISQKYISPDENVCGVYKYQAYDEIARKIIICLGVKDVNINTSNSRIIGVYSLDATESKTLFSLNMAKVYSETKRVLYINLEEFSGLGQLLSDTGNMTLSDALYYYRQNREQIDERILAGISSVNGVDYIPPVLSAEDIAYVDTGQIMEFVQKLSKAGRYEVVVLDISQGVKQQWRMICECNDIYMPVYAGYLSDRRMRDFEIYFIESGMENVLNSIKRVELPGGTERLNEDFWRTDNTEPMYGFVKSLITEKKDRRAG